VKPDPDALPTKLLAHPTAIEARAWLTLDDGISRTLGESDLPSLSRALVERFYTAGAVRVTATEISRYEQESLDGVDCHENTGRLVVELPKNAQGRRKVFRLAAKIARGLGFDPTEDVGQRYL
jgi:hypothetical protein